MFNDNGVKLIPADKRFCPEDACEKEVTEATDEQIKQIMKYRQDFFLQFYDSDRKKRINERLTNKENFIYTNNDYYYFIFCNNILWIWN